MATTGTVLTLYSADGEHYLQFSAPDVMTSNQEISFPATPGLAGQVLISNGDGTTYFGANGGGGGGLPQGANLSLQFNNSGTFGGASAASYNPGTNVLTVGSLTVSTTLVIPAASVALSRLQTAIASSKVVGSGASGAGSPYEELGFSSDFSISGTTITLVPFRSDLTPSAVTASVGSAGSSALTSRYDHTHQVSTAAPVSVGTANSEGSASTLSRSDHVHAVPFSAVNAALSAASASISVNSQKITNLLDPTNPQDAATRAFVLANVSAGWALTGNSGTNSSTNFIGTTDNVDVVVRSNNIERLRVEADVNAITCSVDEFARTNNSGSLVISGGAIGSTRPNLKFFGSSSASPNEVHLQTNRFRIFTETGSTEYAEIQSGGMILYGGVLNRGATNSGITIRGGDSNANGAGLQLYGQSHATFANQSYYDASRHTFRSQNGTKKFLEVDDTANVINVTPYGTSVGETTPIVFRERNNSGASGIGFKAPDTVNSSLIFTLPATDGGNRSVLRTNGSQGLSFGYLNTTVVTATYNIASSDDVIICNNSSNIDINLPTLSSDINGRVYFIKRLATSTGTVTIVSSAGPLSIEGTGATYSVAISYCIQIMAKFPDLWLIIGQFL